MDDHEGAVGFRREDISLPLFLLYATTHYITSGKLPVLLVFYYYVNKPPPLRPDPFMPRAFYKVIVIIIIPLKFNILIII